MKEGRPSDECVGHGSPEQNEDGVEKEFYLLNPVKKKKILL